MDTLPQTRSPHSGASEDSALNQPHIAYGRKVKELLRLAVRNKVTPRPELKIFGYVHGIYRPAQGLFSQEADMIREVMTGLFHSKNWCFSFGMLGG